MPKRRILIVDDEATLTRLLELHLQDRYEVRVENRGSLALQAAREFQPDLILLDLLMPDLTGREVLLQIRGDPHLQRIPVVFLTAAMPEAQERATMGAASLDLWIAKPARAAEVMERIEKQLPPEPGRPQLRRDVSPG